MGTLCPNMCLLIRISSLLCLLSFSQSIHHPPLSFCLRNVNGLKSVHSELKADQRGTDCDFHLFPIRRGMYNGVAKVMFLGSL